jgi:signal recognition particle subunit SEC65
MTTNSIDVAEAAIESALVDAFGTKKGTILDKMRKAGRRLPREVAADVASLEEMRKRTAHPRRRGQIDVKRVQAARDNSIKALKKIDVARDKARARINWLGVLVINLTMFGVAYYALIKWLGLI